MKDRNSRLRWRDKRDSLVARRHRRRHRRRHITRPGEYKPVRADAGSASRGVRSRLLGALGASLTTLVCLVVTLMTGLSTFGGTFAVTVGLSSFGFAIALVLSARHEEQVHALANHLERDLPPLSREQTSNDTHASQLPPAQPATSDPLSPQPDRTRTPTPTGPQGTDGQI
jgi:hypothetical protein